MTDENVSESQFNRIQYSFFVNGDQMVFRTDNGDELRWATESVAENMEAVQKAISSIKKTVVATGVFTGDSQKKGASERATDSPPPASNDGTPLCDKHGEPMKDLSGRGYRRRWYCPKSREEAKGCLPKD